MGRQLRSLDGQVVAITGGGRGIGRATAAALIAKGARVAIGDIDGPLAERTASELGSDTIGLPLDVTDQASFTEFLDAVESRLGPLDVLVNNAGIMPVGPFVDEADPATTKLVDVNVMGVIIGSKLALAAVPAAWPWAHRPARLDRRQGRVPRRRHVLRDQARRRRPYAKRCAPSSAAPAPASRCTRCCRSASTPSFTQASSRPAASRRPSPRTSPTRSSSCCRPDASSSTCRGYMAAVVRMNALMPRRFTEAINRITNADRLLLSADPSARAAYDARMAQMFDGPAVPVAVPDEREQDAA